MQPREHGSLASSSCNATCSFASRSAAAPCRCPLRMLLVYDRFLLMLCRCCRAADSASPRLLKVRPAQICKAMRRADIVSERRPATIFASIATKLQPRELGGAGRSTRVTRSPRMLKVPRSAQSCNARCDGHKASCRERRRAMQATRSRRLVGHAGCEGAVPAHRRSKRRWPSIEWPWPGGLLEGPALAACCHRSSPTIRSIWVVALAQIPHTACADEPQFG